MRHNFNSRDGSNRRMIDYCDVDAEVTGLWASGHEQPAAPEEDTDEKAADSLTWRRDFLARLIPDLETRRLRTRDADCDTTEETLQCVRLSLDQLEARLSARFGPSEPTSN